MELTIRHGGTTTTTGGTNQIFGASGETVASGKVLVDASEADYFAREKITVVSRMPVPDGLGGFTKQKSKVQIVKPFITSKGDVVYDVARVEIEVHPESSALAELREKIAQAAKHVSLNAFFTVGSLD